MGAEFRGDETETWYNQSVTRLYRFVYGRVQNRAEAEDITQEAYVRCLKMYKGRNSLPPYAYLRQTAQNLIYDRYRSLLTHPVSTVDPKRPQQIYARAKSVVFAYGDTVVSETVPDAPFVLSPGAALGQADGGQLEVLKDSLRWRQGGLEIKAEGPRALELARQLAKITLPQAGQGTGQVPQVKVPVNMEVVRNSQQQVDAGSSPWQLDPLQVAQTFVALKMSPGGIKGNPPVAYSSFKLAVNTGAEAVVRVAQGPVKTVYLKRLVRQDASGIWTVVGYAPR
ncbi:RNA polymerase sigma factor, region 2 [Acididesulfobacillus acetoxydans]|uniref:RNA polymerase sigma factor, region 2 n=1 Tax=Acididesulfobacillus acetoxydans TaxID=1561005 RepID=A0A8S0XVS9_9FIRM|nr:RNA polymerase sigma factor [Acididesulfobacillus acetoxydans]CAA7600567.1 RNA polymerase sigma factor, region 2 [Acididesulfobacillus acetoxydans]CEJ06701.1 RNA polymerase sigma factor, region 2 [Acididesulfobacillus acetoxydans]